MKKVDEFENNHPEHLFDMKLQYSQQAVECAPFGIKEGRIIGSGNGSVEGSDIKGTIRWSNYENTIREGFCKLQIPGAIQTYDGEQILFEARGIAIVPDKSHSSKWSAAGVFRFDTGSEKYKWLNSDLAVYEGEFRMETRAQLVTGHTLDLGRTRPAVRRIFLLLFIIRISKVLLCCERNYISNTIFNNSNYYTINSIY